MIRRGVILSGAALALSLGACASKSPQIYQLPSDPLYELAMQKLDERKWNDAIKALDQFTARFPSDPRTEEARFQLGSAYFEKKDFITAAAELVRLASDYPTGRFAVEARYKTCESYYRLSPRPQLDQEYTRAAIDHCDALIVSYPSSDFATQAEELITDLREKLARKAYLNGDYYYKRKAYDSAILYYEALLREYPQSSSAPKALLRLVQTYQRLRYAEELEAARDLLLTNFPDSNEARQARDVTLPEGAEGP
jgi:outer membrane protein assembly factor BamD